MSNTLHWTGRSTEDFLYSIASDFVEDLRHKMKAIGMNQSKLAKAAKVNKSYVSRIFNDPGNLTLDTIVKFAHIVGLKVSIVAYEDNDKKGEHGPIDPHVFLRLWENAERPADIWAIPTKTVAQTTNTLDLSELLSGMEWGWGVHNKTTTNPARHRAANIGSRPLSAKVFALASTDLGTASSLLKVKVEGQ